MTTQDAPVKIYNDRPRECPQCHDKFPGFRTFWDHAIDAHAWTWRDGRLKPPDERQIGIGRSALYVIGIWPVPYVHRETVKALAALNVGDGSNSWQQFGKALSKAETDGLLRRDGEWIRVIDQGRIYDRAIDSIASPQHEKFLTVKAAIPVISAQIRAERDAAKAKVRSSELAFIKSLMRPYSGPMSGSRRPVRVIASGRI